MKKIIKLILLFNLVHLFSYGQIRLTEINPISNQTDSKFFELFNYTQNSISENHYLLVYTRDGNNVPKMFVGNLSIDDKFQKSSNISQIGFTPGSIVCAKNTSSNKFSKVPADAIHDWAALFETNWEVYSYDFTLNGGSGSWTKTSNATSTLDPFDGYKVNDKIAILLFKENNFGDPKMVDVVADFFGTAEEIYGYNKLNALNKNFNLSELRIGNNKFVNEALGVNNSYQLVKETRSNLPACDLAWKKISVETPGLVSGFIGEAVSWSVDYFLPLFPWNTIKQDNILSPTEIINLNNSNSFTSSSNYFTKIDDQSYELRIILGLSNPMGIADFQNLVVSVYGDADGDRNVGNYANNSTTFIFDDPYLKDRSGNNLGPFDIDAPNRGLLLATYGINQIWQLNESDLLVEFKVVIPSNLLDKRIYFFTGYKSSGTNTNLDYCFGTEKYFQLPSALPAQFKTSALKIIDGKARYTWTTSSEQNNKGFEVQRSVGNTNNFKTIGFVGTRAKDGNSQIEINYSFDDADLKAGVVHYYRLNQVDFDGKTMLTPIKSIKPGSIETDLSVYPNPNQGSFLVNASKLSGRVSIFLIDNTGRILNHFNNVAESTTRISNLKTGFYTLKIVNTETGEQTAQRIVVQ